MCGILILIWPGAFHLGLRMCVIWKDIGCSFCWNECGGVLVLNRWALAIGGGLCVCGGLPRQKPHLHRLLLPFHGDGAPILQIELRVSVLRRLQTPGIKHHRHHKLWRFGRWVLLLSYFSLNPIMNTENQIQTDPLMQPITSNTVWQSLHPVMKYKHVFTIMKNR